MPNTNDIKSGAHVRLRNGLEAVVTDNQRGNIRSIEMSTQQGKDWGSCYAHDIMKVLVDGVWHDVEHTREQLALKRRLDEMGM